MKQTFVIDCVLDDAGVPEYFAWKEDDFDANGNPFPDSLVGHGESELYALIDLLDKFAVRNEYEEDQSIH
jgi:hypothetical protein